VVWEGWRREVSPYPDHRRNLVVPARSGERPLTILFADLRRRAVETVPAHDIRIVPPGAQFGGLADRGAMNGNRVLA
jgi:hypothetical protein